MTEKMEIDSAQEHKEEASHALANEANAQLDSGPAQGNQMDTVQIKSADGASNTASLSTAQMSSENTQVQLKEVGHETVQDESTQEETIQRQCPCGTETGVCHCDFTKTKEDVLIYAVGVLKPIFPNAGLEHAFNAAARHLAVSEYDYYKVFSYLDTTTKTYPYFYIAEQIDWVLRINHKDCYVLVPRSKTELLGFIEAVKFPVDSLQEIYSTAVGTLGESAATTVGMLPKVLCNHLYSQTLDELHNKLKKQTGVATAAIQDVLKQLEFSPNHGDTNFNRAKNYLAFRYPDIYLVTHSLQKASADASGDNANSLSIQPKTHPSTESPSEAPYFLDTITPSYSDLMSSHTIVDIVLTYKSKSSKQEKYYHCAVDVTRQFPFVNTPLRSFMPVEPMKGQQTVS